MPERDRALPRALSVRKVQPGGDGRASYSARRDWERPVPASTTSHLVWSKDSMLKICVRSDHRKVVRQVLDSKGRAG